MLQLTGLRIVAFLPSKLSDKTIAEPDHQNSSKVCVSEVDLVTQHIPTSEVAVHQGPWLVDDFALDNFTHKFTKFLSKRKQLIVKSSSNARVFLTYRQFLSGCPLSKGARHLIIFSTIIMPPVLFLFQDNKIDRLYWSLSLFNPLKNELQGTVLWVYRISLKDRLNCYFVTPSRRTAGQMRILRSRPITRVLAPNSPMKDELLFEVHMLSNQINSVPIDDLFWCFLFVIDITFFDLGYSALGVTSRDSACSDLALSVFLWLLLC